VHRNQGVKPLIRSARNNSLWSKPAVSEKQAQQASKDLESKLPGDLHDAVVTR
jgi:hypothetical protein